MATYFGEILPVCSRAVDDEEDDEDCQLKDQRISVIWASGKAADVFNLKCTNFIIAVGPTATAFTQVFLLQNGSAEVGQITSEEVPNATDSDIKCQKKSFPIYQVKDTVILQCTESVLPEFTYQFVQQLFRSIDVKSGGGQVCVLGSTSINDYKCSLPTTDLEVPFLRALKTSTLAAKLACPFLEQPNTVSSLSAQILTHCEIHQIKAVLYQTFTETLYLDVDSIKSFKKVFTLSPFHNLLQDSPEAKELILKLTNSYAEKNSLYM